MSEDHGRSIAGGMFADAHRSLHVSKVENGFVVSGKFNIPGEVRPFGNQEDRKYVFYTVEEVLYFVQNYLEAKKEEL